MKQNTKKNFYEEDTIDLRELLKIFIDAKKIIITITLICAVIAAGYTYFIQPEPKPVYQSSAKLMFGHYNNEPIRELMDLEHKIKFLYGDKNVRISKNGGLEIKVNGPSIEYNHSLLQEIVDYAVNLSKERVDFLKNKELAAISDFDNRITSISSVLSKLTSRDNISANEGKELSVEQLIRKNDMLFYISDLSLELDSLEFKKETLITKLNRTDLYQHTSLVNEIVSNQIADLRKSNKNILFISIVGFMLSIVVIFIRHLFLKEQE